MIAFVLSVIAVPVLLSQVVAVSVLVSPESRLPQAMFSLIEVLNSSLFCSAIAILRRKELTL